MRHPSKQKGITLLSLLCGITLSMISMLACLSLYTQHQLSSGRTTDNVAFNSQMTHAMMIIYKEISNAGFGITSASNNHIVVNSSVAGETSLYWRYMEGGATVCRGLQESSLTINGQAYRSMSIIRAALGCGPAVNLSTLDWSDSTVFAHWLNDAAMTSFLNHSSNANGTLFQFALSGSAIDCSPYNGIDPSAPHSHLNVSVSVPTSAQLNGNTTIDPYSLEVCLTNL